MTEKEKVLQGIVTESSPSTPLDHALLFAFVRQTEGTTQVQYSKAVGISDRTLRKYLADHQKEYTEELAKHEKKEEEFDLSKMNRSLSEEQLDKFVNNIFERATAKDSTVREWEFLLNFTGLTASDVLSLREAKNRSLRWWIKGELSSISNYLDTKNMGVMLQSSEYLYRGDKGSMSNTQNFVNADVSDEIFMLEMAYQGMLFTSLYNNVAHPDLETLATAVRVNRLENGIQETFNKHEVSKYAKGKSISDSPNKPMTDEQLLEMFMMIHEDRAKAQEALLSHKEAKLTASKVVKAPEVIVPDVQMRASKYADELEVLLSVEEELMSMMRKSSIKNKN